MPDDNPYDSPTAGLLSEHGPDVQKARITRNIAPRARVGIYATFWGAFLLWCAFDGWVNPDPEMIQHQTFNRVMTFVAAAIFAAHVFAIHRIGIALGERRSNESALLFLTPDGRRIRVATAPWLWSVESSGLHLVLHGRVGLGVLVFVASQLTLGLAGLVLAFFARGILERRYESIGWTRLQ